MLSSAKKIKPKSYAQAAKSATPSAKISLLHSEFQDCQDDNEKYNRTLQTRIYRTPRNKGAWLFDISALKGKYTDQQAMTAIKVQHPGSHACSPLSDGPTRYLEVYIYPHNDKNAIGKNGVVFENSNLRILPCKAIDDTAKAIQLKLSHLPMFTPEEVLEGLKTSLGVFGEIVDLGIYTDSASGFFMGSGYAVINTFQDKDMPKEQKYVELSHQISWCESEDEFFHATWNNMPTWCRYCHKEGHTKFNCPLSRARILCYSCHEQGHRSFECTRRNVSNIQFKKTDRKSYKNNEKTSHSNNTRSGFQAQENKELEPVGLSVSNVEEDNMSTSEETESIIDEDEQIFRDNVEIIKEELDNYSSEKITEAIRQVYEANEIAPTEKTVATQGGIKEWKVLTHTVRAEALVGWLKENNHAYISQSSNISHRRPSQLTVEDFLSSPTTNLNNSL
jgi:hypothetical protein